MSDIPAQIETRNRNQRRSVTRDNAFPIQQGGGYFQILIPAVQPQTSLLPQYLPPDYRTRDRILDSTVRADAMWSAAIGIAITKAAALSWDVKSDVPQRSKRAQELLLGADSTNISGIGGWVSYMGKQLRNFTCTNAGCFTEIIRATGAYGSRIVGLGHLSSLRMRRTGDPEYPYIYIDRWGHQHVMRWWQVFNLVDMPDPDESALGMGLCAAERAYQQIRKLAALETYIYEKVSGSRPLALHIVNGLTQQQLQDMVAGAAANQAQKGLSLYMGAIVATTLKPDAAPGLVTIPLAELPDGFEAAQERERADLIYANALGLDPQDLRPISNQQMGAGAQSQVLNQKAEGRGQAAYRQQLTHMLNQLVLDDKTKFLFTEHDYQDQKAAAEVSNARAGFVSTLVAQQILSANQAQMMLAEQDEIPQAIIDAGQGESPTQLSDTDKQDVEEYNDQSMPSQPTAVPVMQQQEPQAVSPEDAPPPTAPGAIQPPRTNRFGEQKGETPSRASQALRNRSVHASARRLLRQVRGAGAIKEKGWVTIHGHHVLIGGSGTSGGGGGGGGGAVTVTNEEEARKVSVDLQSSWAQEMKQKDQDAVDAVRQYGGVGYVAINNEARREVPTGAYQSVIDGMDRAISSAPALKHALTTYRGIGGSTAQMINDRFKSGGSTGVVGIEITDKGYVSTTLVSSVARKFAPTSSVDLLSGGFVIPTGDTNIHPTVMRLKVPKGAHGLFVDNLIGNNGEAEFVLPRNRKMKISGAELDSSTGVLYVDASVE